ncbi:protein-cysteine N-palmitoyltransferase HHAT-like [Diadema setosum]|uniref:protein-cysteine N-palmitoyltransferase HHAT-like n=1 Tax=Diadema setosum TaxID=31175 RepID=UPI003B3B156D
MSSQHQSGETEMRGHVENEQTSAEERVASRACNQGNPDVKRPVVSAVLLPKWELFLYALVVVTTYGYATYRLFRESQDFQRRTATGNGYLQPGWSLLGDRYQDIMPHEWSHWKHFTLNPTALAVYAGHVTGGFFFSKFSPRHRKWFLLMSSLAGTAVIIGHMVFLAILLHALLAFVAVSTGRVWVVWAVCLSQLASLINQTSLSLQLSFIPKDDPLSHSKFLICLAFCSLRFIAFGAAHANRLPKKEAEKNVREDGNGGEEAWTFWDFLLYVFYLPTSAHGPITSPKGFFHQIKQPYYPQDEKGVRWVCLQWLRPLLNAIFLEWLHHYLYISTFLSLRRKLSQLSVVALIALGEWVILIFQIQYMVYYGFAKALAIFDGVLLPALPICFQTITSFHDGWRYFDRGEHQFILRNIYIPVGGSQHGALRRSLALATCFAFSCFWHGGGPNIVAMMGMHVVGIQCEVSAPVLLKKLGIAQLVSQHCSTLTQRRIRGLVAGAKYPLLVWTLLLFLEGFSTAAIFVRRIFGEEAYWVVPSLVAVHYCSLQVVEELNQRWGRNYLHKKLYMDAPSVADEEVRDRHADTQTADRQTE